MNERASFTFGPLDRSGVILGLRLGQLGLLACGGTVAIVLLLGTHGSVVAAGVAVIGIVASMGLALVPVSGRGVDEWIPVLARWMIGSRTWRSPAPVRGQLVTGSGALVDAQGALPPTLDGLTLLSVRLPGGASIGIAKDRSHGTYTSVIRVTGSSYVLLSDQEKEAQLAAWGAALSSLAHRESPIEAVQLIVRNVTEDPDGIARYVEEAMDIDPNDSIFRSYLSLIDSAAPVTQTQEVFVALTVSNRRAGRAIAAAGGNDNGAAVVLIRALSQLETQLSHAQIRSDGVLPPRLLAQVYREAWDPTSAHALRRRSSMSDAEEGISMAGAGPQSTRATWRYLVTDGGATHATYWISEWPRISVGANFLVPLLLQTNARLTFSVTMAPVDPSRAERDIEAAQTAHLSDEMMRSQHGFRTPVRAHRQADAVEQREREFADGHAEYRFAGYLTVTAASPGELEIACGEVTQQARNSRLDLRRMDGEHDLAFTYTLPLGRGLR